MPIDLVPGEVDAYSQTSGTGTFVNISPVSGNLLVAVFNNGSGTAQADVSGWTKLTGGAGSMSTYLFYRISDGTETSFTPNYGVGVETWKVLHFEGNATSAVLDDWDSDATNASGASTTCFSGTATATVTDALALFAAVSRDQRFMEAGTLSVNNSFTAISVATNTSLGIASASAGIEIWGRDVTATGNYSCTETSTDTGDENIGILAIFKALAAPITFSGTIPTLNGQRKEAFSVDLSGYFTGTETPFSYSLASGSLASTGLSLNTSTCIVSGTPTVTGDITGLSIEGEDDASNTDTSNTFTISVAPATVPDLSDVTITSIDADGGVLGVDVYY